MVWACSPPSALAMASVARARMRQAMPAATRNASGSATASGCAALRFCWGVLSETRKAAGTAA